MAAPAEDGSDDESTGGSIPFNKTDEGKEPATAGGKTNNEKEDEEANDEEGDEEVYVVEKIIGHEFAKNGTLFLQVKWKGYENPEDLTMEPEDNLVEGAQEAVEEYYHELGGRPEKPTKKRKSPGEAKATLEEAERKRRRRPKGAAGTETPEGDEIGSWVPKGKSWENDVASVDTVSRESSGNLYAYLVWTNGKKSKVSTELCYRKCPMKLLKFYEDHLVFKDGDG